MTCSPDPGQEADRDHLPGDHPHDRQVLRQLDRAELDVGSHDPHHLAITGSGDRRTRACLVRPSAVASVGAAAYPR